MKKRHLIYSLQDLNHTCTVLHRESLWEFDTIEEAEAEMVRLIAASDNESFVILPVYTEKKEA